MDTGLKITLTGPEGVAFEHSYAREDAEHAFEAMQRLVIAQKRYYILSVSPCEPPPRLLSIKEWIAAGGTSE